jgi:hypothetical protein
MELAPAPGAAVGFREGERAAVDEQVLHGSLRGVAGDSIATGHAWTRGDGPGAPDALEDRAAV